MPVLNLSSKRSRVHGLFSILVVLACLPIASYAQVPGCTDPLATNFNDEATINDGSCVYPATIISYESRVQLPSVMDETSGLIFWNNKFWTHNDDTDLNLYGFSFENPEEYQTIALSGLSNIDWEELTQDDNYLYIGEFGNNSGNRTDLKIYKISKATALAGNPQAEIISFSYEDQTDFNPPGANQTDFDAEAFIVKGDRIFIFTKEWVSRGTTVYEIPNQPGTHVAVNRGRLQIDAMVTGSVYLEQENLLAFIGYNFPNIGPTFIYLLYDFQGDDFFGGNKRMLVLRLTDFVGHQVEAITTKDGLTFYATNEFASGSGLTIPQRMHSFDLSPFLETYLSSLPTTNRYYYRGYGELTQPESWATNPNGSGRSPEDFSTDNMEYVISTSDSFIIDTLWNITGSNVRVTVGHDGGLPVAVTLESPVQATFNVKANASLIIDGVQPPTFRQLADNSTIEIKNTANVILSESDFYHLSITNSEFGTPESTLSLSFRGDVILNNNQNTLPEAYSLTFYDSNPQVFASDLPLTLSQVFINKTDGLLEITMEDALKINQLFQLESGEISLTNELILASGGLFWNDTVMEPELTFERNISAPIPAQNSSYWTLITSPVSGAIAGENGLLGSIWTQGFPDSDDPVAESSSVYFFNPDASWQRPQENAWTPGLGYAVQINDLRNPNLPNNPIDFGTPLHISGTQNVFSGDGFVFPNLSYTTHATSGNFHLLGNPFAISLDWSVNTPEAWQRSGINEFIYLWNPMEERYLIGGMSSLPESLKGLITTEPVIGPFQSFWIQTLDENPSLIVGKQARSLTHPNNELFNNQENQPVIALSFNDSHYTALLLDGAFYRSSPVFVEYLQPLGDTYSYLYYCSNGTPALLGEYYLEDIFTDIPIYLGSVAPFTTPTAEGTLRWPVFEYITPNYIVTLTDNETGITVDLREESSYTFEYTPNPSDEGFGFTLRDCPTDESSARFILSFVLDILNVPSIPSELPTVSTLHQNYPNPFNPSTGISFDLAQTGTVYLGIYDMLGRLVSVITNETLAAGNHTYHFDASHLSSGVYLYKLRTESGQLTRKMTLLK